MTEPLLFIDEDFPLDTAVALRERHFTVIATVETDVRGLSDLEQMRRAAEMGAVLVSDNYTERRRFVAYGRDLRQAGFVNIAAVLLPHEPPGLRLLLRTAMLDTWLLRLPDPRPPVVYWNHLAQRLIQGERVEGFSEDDVRVVMGWNRQDQM